MDFTPKMVRGMAQAWLSEFIAQILFVMTGCGCAMLASGSESGTFRLLVSLGFGLAIVVLVYMTCHIEGSGQINPAVTISLMVGGALKIPVGVGNIIAQFLGSLIGAGALRLLIPCDKDLTRNIAKNFLGKDFSYWTAYILEFVFTFFLCYVVWQVAVNPRSKGGHSTPLAVGFTVFLAHLILIPIDGCSINPSRSFGPAIIAYFDPCEGAEKTSGLGWEELVMWTVFPILGGIAAALVYRALTVVAAAKGSGGGREGSAGEGAAGSASEAEKEEGHQDRGGAETAVSET